MTDLDTLAVQVGREVVAKRYEERGYAEVAESIRTNGEADAFGSIIFAEVLHTTSGARAMLAKLREMGLVVEWRPIEEAKKDGNRVLLHCPNLDETKTIARWFEPWGNWQSGDFPHDPENDEYFGIGSKCPTHFAKLPNGPGHD